MILFFKVHPEIGRKRRAHKAFRHALVHQLVQPLLDARADPEGAAVCGPGRRTVSEDTRLKGKHFSESLPVRKKCTACAYKRQADGKRKDTKTVNYCRKCDKHICKGCFETYHTKSIY